MTTKNLRKIAATMLASTTLATGAITGLAVTNAHAGTITGTCATGTYNASDRMCHGTRTETIPYTFSTIHDGPQQIMYPNPDGLDLEGIMKLSLGGWDQAEQDRIRVSYASGYTVFWHDRGAGPEQWRSYDWVTVVRRNDIPAGYTDNGSAWVRTVSFMAAPVGEVEDASAVVNAYAYVRAATTSAEASSRMAAANALRAGLTLDSARVATQGDYDAAVVHINALVAAEAEAQNEAQRKQAAISAINAVLAATNAATAQTLLDVAGQKVAALTGANQAALMPQLVAAGDHYDALVAAEILARDIATANAAIAAVMATTTSADAQAELAVAELAVSAVPGTDRGALTAGIEAARAHLAGLITTEQAARDEAQRKQDAIDAIAAVTNATDAATARALMTVAEAKVAALSSANQTALTADQDAARAHVDALVAAEQLARDVATAETAISDTINATTVADATRALSDAEAAVANLPAAEAAAAQARLELARDHLADLIADQIARASEAARNAAFDAAISAANRADDYGQAIAHATAAQAIFDTLNNASKQAARAALDAVIARAEALKPVPAGDRGASASTDTSMSGDGAPEARVAELVKEMRTTVNVNQLIQLSAQIAELLAAHPELAAAVQDIVDDANQRIAEALDRTQGRIETVQRLYIRHTGSNVKHFDEVRTASTANPDALLVTIAADKGTPVSARKAYQAKVLGVLDAAGIDRDRIIIVKPKATETVTVYVAG